MSVNDSKRYYWLKLKNDFFSSRRMKKLRSIAGGDTYTIIYLKLQLHALKTDGMLTFENLEDDVASEFALEIDEKPDDVRMTLAFLQKYGLIETSDNINYFLPYVAANVGSETGAAERMRIKRSAGLANIREHCSPEIEKEIELDIEAPASKNLSNVNMNTKESNQISSSIFKYYEQNISPLTPIVGEKLKALIDEVGEIKVRMAITEAATHDARSYAYIEAVAHKKGNRPTKVNEMPGAERCETQLDADTEKLYQRMLKGECDNEGGFE